MKEYLVIKNKQTGKASVTTRSEREDRLMRNELEGKRSIVLRKFLIKKDATDCAKRINEGHHILKTINL